MKKYFLSVFVLSACFGFTFAQPMPKGWHSDIENYTERQMARQQQLLTKETMDSPLLLEIPITKQYFPAESANSKISFENSQEYRSVPAQTYSSTVGCKAYAIDEHWIMAGASCLWNGRHQIIQTGHYVDTGLVEIDESKVYLRVNGEEIKMEGNLFVQPRFTLLPHVILVRIPQNTLIAKRIKALPKPEILAFVKQDPAFFHHNKCMINSSRLGLNTNGEREIKSSNFSKGTVTVPAAWNEYDGLSTDPIFFVNNSRVLWFGFNNGVTETSPNRKWRGKASEEYTVFSFSDIEFIKKVLQQKDANALKRLSSRMHVDTL